ncbi:MAG: hypothetical protein ACLPN6_16940 [Streptosporangiaceae bacterium]|jgi:hypothetical protein
MSGFGALIAGIAFFAVPPQAGYASTNCSDCYVVTPATNPATAGAGTGDVYAFQVTNNDPHEYLVSLTFTVPTDFVITGATGPSGTSVSALTDSSVTLSLPSEPTGSTFAVDVTALAPCVFASSEVWGVSGIDSRGETSEVQWSSSPLSVSVSGQCSLAFTGQPAETAVNSDILTGFNSTGSPLAVQLLDANSDPLNPANFSASGTPVTISILTNPANGTLTGTTTVPSSNGVADFGNLQINNPGAAYDLAANASNASGFTSATSSFFTVTGQIQACGTGSCSASQSTSTTTTSVTTSSASGNFVTLGLGGVTLTCNHYNAVSDVTTFGVFNSSGGSVTSLSAIATLTISKSAVESSPRPLLLWQVCYGSQTPFPAIPGTSGTTTIGSTTYHTGLLLPCFLFSPGNPEPCLISQRYTAAGSVQLKFVALGDPIYRG